MDRFHNVLLLAGLGCFALAFLLSGIYPWLITDARQAEATIRDVSRIISPDFRVLKEQYPVVFRKAFAGGDKDTDAAWHDAYADALKKGRDIYVREACWHCHSQYVRPVANESVRFGRVQKPIHDNNALQRPVLWGTRRVGPDLTHEGGLRSNDWHIAHFWNPRSTSPGSVMPTYPWFFQMGWGVSRKISPETATVRGLSEDTTYDVPGLYDTKAEAEAAMQKLIENMPGVLDEEKERLFVRERRGPNADGLAVTAYLQWLGTWEPEVQSEN